MASTVDFDYVREQCLRQLRLLRAEAAGVERQLENLQLPVSPEVRVALLIQLQRSAQVAYDHARACRQLAKFLQQQAERMCCKSSARV